FDYTPAENFTGTDFFTYSVTDGAESSAARAVSIDVLNTTPEAVGRKITAHHGQTITITVDSWDAVGDKLQVVFDPSYIIHGTLAQSEADPFTFTYTANEDVGNETDVFTYTVGDGVNGQLSQSEDAEVSLVIQNAKPVISDATFRMRPGQTVGL